MQNANALLDGFMLGLAVWVGAGATLGFIFLLTQVPKFFRKKD